MTETSIRKLAVSHDLAVYKRITTGNSKRHFATFELSGSPSNVSAAWETIRDVEDYNRLKGALPMTTMSRSDADGTPYIELDSVWCEVE